MEQYILDEIINMELLLVILEDFFPVMVGCGFITVTLFILVSYAIFKAFAFVKEI